SSFNISAPQNKLVSFPGLSTNPTYKNLYAVGKSLFIHSSYRYTGVDPQTGVYTYQDVNKDGLINTLDKQLLKQITQNYFGGFQNAFSYKGFQLDIFIQFVKQTGVQYMSGFG